MLREIGQNVIQPFLMRLAKTSVSKKIAEKLLPLVTIKDCRECPALHHCLNACMGFKRLYLKEAGKC